MKRTRKIAFDTLTKLTLLTYLMKLYLYKSVPKKGNTIYSLKNSFNYILLIFFRIINVQNV